LKIVLWVLGIIVLSALLRGVGVGPEDIAIGPDGWMYTGYRDGRIVRFDAKGQHEEFVNTGGFPLGMRFSHHDNIYMFLEGRATGRLLSYSRVTGDVTVRLEELAFPNGVAVAPSDEYVLVNETAGGRIRRLWLTCLSMVYPVRPTTCPSTIRAYSG
jgi:sugar lactone lactonase YvrE